MITPIGLYSISVRGLEVPGLLGWAASYGVPFVHLRGGPRGVDLAAQSTKVVWQWRKAAVDTGVPITGVTADADLADLLTDDVSARARAAQKVVRLAESAALLGAEWVRLLARTPLTGREPAGAARLPVLANSAVPLLVELHHPGWMEPDAFVPLVELVDACPAVWLLADTAQLAAAIPAGSRAPAWLGCVLDQAKAVHLSDTGAGLDTAGHALVASPAAARIDAGQRLEVALEWTGADRSPSACLARPTQPGVINVHRLKRLYRGPDGERTLTAAKNLVERLAGLRDGGWRIVWTVHNLLPIDGGPPSSADWHAALGVLGVADTVLTHTCSDAVYLSRLTKAPVIVAGWSGLSAPTTFGPEPEAVGDLTGWLRAAPYTVLVVGNLTAYKDLPAVVGAFTGHTRHARLLVAGPCRDETLAAELEAAAQPGGGRARVYPHRIPPEHVYGLYRAADAALCPYRVDGPWEFFTQVLYPGSVGTALAFGPPGHRPGPARHR
ncbi:hypothetical protein GCM10023075_60570 [Streptosporangium album]